MDGNTIGNPIYYLIIPLALLCFAIPPLAATLSRWRYDTALVFASY